MNLAYRLKSVEVAPGLALAPMEGVTDLTFRRLVRSIGGCGITFTEFIPAKNLRLNIKAATRLAVFDEDESPICIQIYGNDPEIMADGARIVEDLGADVLDLNMGCPSKKVCARSGGSALMKDLDLSRDIVSAMRAATDLPFTVKMRSGWDTEHKNAPEMARMCEEEGADGLAVHWRTRTDKYGGVRELETIRQVKDSVSIPVLANGDIIDVASANQTLAATGCDGLMIGRGAIRDPWVFRKIEADLRGECFPEVDALERKRVLLGYLDAIRGNFKNDKGVLGRFKKIARHFTDGVENGAELRQAIFHSHSLVEVEERVDAFFAGAARAPSAAAS